MHKIFRKNIVRLAEWTTIIGFVISLMVLAVSAFQYITIEKSKQRQQTFNNYHTLIEKFGGGSKHSITAAVVYELRNYPEYCDLSLRLMEHFQKEWSDKLSKKEMQLTITALKISCKTK